MIAAAFLTAALISAPPPSAASWCDSLQAIAQATAEARAAGLSRMDAERAVHDLPTIEARRAGIQIVTLAYSFNADGRMRPARFARLVRDACVASEGRP